MPTFTTTYAATLDAIPGVIAELEAMVRFLRSEYVDKAKKAKAAVKAKVKRSVRRRHIWRYENRDPQATDIINTFDISHIAREIYPACDAIPVDTHDAYQSWYNVDHVRDYLRVHYDGRPGDPIERIRAAYRATHNGLEPSEGHYATIAIDRCLRIKRDLRARDIFGTLRDLPFRVILPDRWTFALDLGNQEAPEDTWEELDTAVPF